MNSKMELLSTKRSNHRKGKTLLLAEGPMRVKFSLNITCIFENICEKLLFQILQTIFCELENCGSRWR